MVKSFIRPLLIRKYEMIFVTLFLAICSLPVNQSVKLMIDGTFDFGPTWNFQYKIKTSPNFDARQRSLNISDEDLKSDDRKSSDAESEGQGHDEEKENIERNAEDIYVGHTAVYKSDENTDERGTDREVTKLYQTTNTTRTTEMFVPSRKIAEDLKIIYFLADIRNRSLQVLNDIAKKFEHDVSQSKVSELRATFIDKFDGYVNETRSHYIKTNLGIKSVLMNAIHYSNRILNGLYTRLKIDAEGRGPNVSENAMKWLREGIDKLKPVALKDACARFNVCRAEREFSDFVNDLIMILIKADDTKIKLAVDALVVELKRADFSEIMDADTQRVFRERLTFVEELGPSELRLLFMAYKIIIEKRHHPFNNPDDQSIKPTVAFYNVIEIYDQNFKLSDHKQWSDSVKDKLEYFVNGKDVKISAIAKEFVYYIQEKGIAVLPSDAAENLKGKLRLFFMSKSLRLNLNNISYIPFRPFVS